MIDPIPGGRWNPPVCRVLVADSDSRVVADLDLLLTTLGHDVRTAVDGVEALGVAAGFRPHAALLAVCLRHVDGRLVAGRLRVSKFGWLRVLIGLTEADRPVEKRSLLATEFDYQLQKPVHPELLATLLVRGRPARAHRRAPWQRSMASGVAPHDPEGSAWHLPRAKSC